MKKGYEIFITQSAENDFQTIWEYISQSNPLNAIEFLDQIEEKISTLTHEPARCPIIPENEFYRDGIYRHLVHKDYRIIFSIREKSIYIMRVFHGAKLLDISELENS